MWAPDPEERPLLRAVLAEPSAPEPRAIYADWLAERRDPRAELLRAQSASDAGPELHRALEPDWVALVSPWPVPDRAHDDLMRLGYMTDGMNYTCHIDLLRVARARYRTQAQLLVAALGDQATRTRRQRHPSSHEHLIATVEQHLTGGNLLSPGARNALQSAEGRALWATTRDYLDRLCEDAHVYTLAWPTDRRPVIWDLCYLIEGPLYAVLLTGEADD